MSNIAIFDADGTLHENFFIFPVYDVFANEGYISKNDNQRVQEVHNQYENNEIDYSEFVVDTLRVAAEVVGGRKLQTASNIAEVFFNSPEFKWFGYVKPMMEEMSISGIRRILLTAEPEFIAEGISSALGFNENYSSQFKVDKDNKFTGEVVTALGSSQKGEITKGLVAESHTSQGYGDSEGDIGMLELVDIPICIEPTQALRAHALTNDWTIIDDANVPDLGLKITGN